MTTQNRIKTVLTLAAVAILALAIGQVQAAAVTVPNGEFNMYKPGTNYTVTANFPDGGPFDNYAQGVGDNRNVAGDGIALYGDGTTGSTVDIPGWVSIVGGTDIGRDGVDGTTAFSAFGTWSGGTGTSAGSADSLGAIAGSSDYTVSAMVNGPAAPLLLELHAGGVALTPSSSVTPVSPTGGWKVISRTYDADDLAAHVGEPMTIVIGTFAEDGVYTGTRVAFDNVTLDVVINDPDLPDVDAGIDMISWSGQAVTMDPTVVNNDTTEPQRTLTYLWTAEPNGIGDPNLDVAITGADTENASVTITKTAPTGDATVVTMTLAVTLEGKDPVTDTMTIDVYDDACVAALDLGLATIDTTDLDGNCITAFPDFAVMAVTWLDDYALTEAVAK
jgi:hypothetical protein